VDDAAGRKAAAACKASMDDVLEQARVRTTKGPRSIYFTEALEEEDDLIMLHGHTFSDQFLELRAHRHAGDQAVHLHRLHVAHVDAGRVEQPRVPSSRQEHLRAAGLPACRGPPQLLGIITGSPTLLRKQSKVDKHGVNIPVAPRASKNQA